MNWCVNMAESLKVGVPWIMCQESDAPQPIVSLYKLVTLYIYMLYKLSIYFFFFIPD